MSRPYYPSCLHPCMRTRKATGTGMEQYPVLIGYANRGRTIHGMVYNAMKLFMEINPQLFDDCSQDYNELQNSADKREQNRRMKWNKLQALADRMKSDLALPAVGGKAAANSDADVTQDSQQRLDALKLRDDTNTAVPQESVSLRESSHDAPVTTPRCPCTWSHADSGAISSNANFFYHLSRFSRSTVSNNRSMGHPSLNPTAAVKATLNWSQRK